MRSQPVSFDDGEVRALLTVHAASTFIATARAILFQAGLQVEVENATEAVLRRGAYPDHIACTTGTIELLDPAPEGAAEPVVRAKYVIESNAAPLPFEVFAYDLPERLAELWGNAVYDLNPQWLPHDPEAQKKAAATSIVASPS